MKSRIIRLSIIAALIALAVWQFVDTRIGNGIFLLVLAGLVIFTYFRNERMIMAMLAMRRNKLDKARKHLDAISDPDRALIRSQRGTYYLLRGVMISQSSMTEAEKCFKKAVSIGLARDEMAMAKLQLAAVAIQKGRKMEAEALLAEVKRLDKKKLLEEQVSMVKQGLKRAGQQPAFYQQQQMRGARRR